MKRYKPGTMDVNHITMADIEQFYSTTLIRKEDRMAISMTAPLIVCMSLHEEIEAINFLLEKYPLVDISGWTPDLEEESDIQHPSYLHMVNSNGNKDWDYTNKMSSSFALTLSNVNDKDAWVKLLGNTPLSHQEADWINRSADDYTRMRYLSIVNKFAEKK